MLHLLVMIMQYVFYIVCLADPRHLACYMVLVKNDALFERYDEATCTVIYTESLSFNFGEK